LFPFIKHRHFFVYLSVHFICFPSAINGRIIRLTDLFAFIKHEHFFVYLTVHFICFCPSAINARIIRITHLFAFIKHKCFSVQLIVRFICFPSAANSRPVVTDCLMQVPLKSNVGEKTSKIARTSHCATTVGITVYIAIQIFLPFSHNFTPVNADKILPA